MKILEALGLERLALLEEAIYNVKECKLHDVYLYRGKREVAADEVEKRSWRKEGLAIKLEIIPF